MNVASKITKKIQCLKGKTSQKDKQLDILQNKVRVHRCRTSKDPSDFDIHVENTTINHLENVILSDIGGLN